VIEFLAGFLSGILIAGSGALWIFCREDR